MENARFYPPSPNRSRSIYLGCKKIQHYLRSRMFGLCFSLRAAPRQLGEKNFFPQAGKVSGINNFP